MNFQLSSTQLCSANPSPAGIEISINQLELNYGNKPVLQIPQLLIPAGQKVALVGPSGAGKSSLLGVIAGTRQANHGQVLLGNNKFGSLSPAQERHLRSQIGMVYQQLNLVDQLRVKHNVLAGKLGRLSNFGALKLLLSTKAIPEVDQALSALQIQHLANSVTANISGGEKQRVALARLLVQNPALILADEPVSSLDEKLAETVLNLLTQKIGQQRTLVVSLHNFEFATKYFDRIVALKQGQIFFDCPCPAVTVQMRQELYANT